MHEKKLYLRLILIISAAAFSAQSYSAQLVIDSSKPSMSTFVQGEKVDIRFHVQGAGAAPTVKYKVSDEDGASILAERAQQVSVDGQGNGDLTVTLPSDRLGYFSITATLGDGTGVAALGTRPAGVFSYAVVVNPNSRQDYGDRLTRFGMQGGFNKDVNVIPLLGIRYVFQQAVEWATAEKDGPGQLKKGDDNARATAAGMLRNKSEPERVTVDGQGWQTYAIAMLTQGKIPKWAFDSASAGKVGGGVNFSAIAADKYPAFTAYAAEHASEMAHDYPNQSTHYYQVTWEPMYPDGYGGTSAQLVDIYKLAYDALHKNDPKAQVAGPTILLYKASEAQLKGLLDAGFANYIDVFSLHSYEENQSWPLEQSGFREDLLRQVGMVRNAAHKPIPFISTEHGFQVTKYGLVNQALANVRSTLILLGEGAGLVVNFYVADFWNKTPQDGGQTWGFYWNLNPAKEYGSDKLGPKPVVPAYAAMTYLLDGTQSKGAVKSLSGSQMGYHFERSGKQIYALWDYKASSTLRVNAGTAQICDWMGNCAAKAGADSLQLGIKPIYVISSSPLAGL